MIIYHLQENGANIGVEEDNYSVPQYSDYDVDDVQICRLQGYDLTYALYNRFPSQGIVPQVEQLGIPLTVVNIVSHGTAHLAKEDGLMVNAATRNFTGFIGHAKVEKTHGVFKFIRLSRGCQLLRFLFCILIIGTVFPTVDRIAVGKGLVRYSKNNLINACTQFGQLSLTNFCILSIVNPSLLFLNLDINFYSCHILVLRSFRHLGEDFLWWRDAYS